MHWGEQTTDEMALAFLGILLPTPADVLPFQQSMRRQMLDGILANLASFDDLPSEIEPATAQRLKAAMVLLDRNKNGKLDDDERGALMRIIDATQR